MPEANSTDTPLYIFLSIAAIIFLILVISKLYLSIKEFFLELRYINCELHRATDSERSYWLRRRKRLWLSLIPFVRY